MNWAKRIGWLLLPLLLGGCEPASLTIDVRSPRRVEQEINAVVAPGRDRLLIALVESALGGGWRVRRRAGGEQVLVTFTRRVSPAESAGLKVERQITGPLRLRLDYRCELANPFLKLAADDMLRRVAASQAVDLVVGIRMPGRILTDDGTNAGSLSSDGATWTLKLSDLAGQPERLTALRVHSRAWRLWLLALLAVVGLTALWVIWPALAPPPEVRARRVEKSAARRRRRAEKAERKVRRQPERTPEPPIAEPEIAAEPVEVSPEPPADAASITAPGTESESDDAPADRSVRAHRAVSRRRLARRRR